jgi:hypothetical protein
LVSDPEAQEAELNGLIGRLVTEVDVNEGIYVDKEGTVFQLAGKGNTKPISDSEEAGDGAGLEQLLSASLKNGRTHALQRPKGGRKKGGTRLAGNAKPEHIPARAPATFPDARDSLLRNGIDRASIGEELPRLNLRQKLAEVRRRIGYIQKRGFNERNNYSYVTAADLAGAVGDAGEPVSIDGGDWQAKAAKLIALCLKSGIELFHDPDQRGWASVKIEQHWENYPLRSRTFQLYLLRNNYNDTGENPGSRVVRAVLELFESRALFDGEECPVHLRVAEHRGKLYLDLCDAAWRAVEIDDQGWRVVDRAPARFRRSRGSRPLPEPELGGNLEGLRGFLNVDYKARP